MIAVIIWALVLILFGANADPRHGQPGGAIKAMRQHENRDNQQ